MERSSNSQPASAGAYAVTADCPGCGICANISTFTATAVDKELTCSTCAVSGLAGRELPNPFIFRVIDKFTDKPVAGVPVTYSVISFIDMNGNASAGSNGASITRVFPVAGTDFYGFNRAYLTPGPQLGTYVVEARCESCLDGQAQIAYGKALNREIKIFAPKTTYADPDHTPIVQITQVQQPNDFTTADGENHVALQARILGEENQSLIRWTVEDDLSDYMDSGVPQLDNTNGPSSGFTLTAPPVGGVLRAATGRPLPLRYKIHAGAEVPGKAVLTQHRTVSQDPIDKCRQEYIDYSISLNEVPRSTFTIGVHPEYSQGFRDCYAYIFPHQRAAEVQRLRGFLNFGITVNSGYRSPRKNYATPGASGTSWHMFGKAVDIEPSPENPDNYQVLWNTAITPKMLERNIVPRIILKRNSGGTLVIGSESSDANGNGIPDVFERANWMHLGE